MNIISLKSVGVAACIAGVACSLAAINPAAAGTKIEKTVVIGGQTITLGIDPSLRVSEKDGRVQVDLSARIDLQALQSVLPQQLAGYRKNDDCGQVLKVSDVHVHPGTDGRIVVSAAIYAAQWTCLRASYPEIRGWEVKMVDHIVVKTIVVEQGGKITVSALPVVSGQTIGLDVRTDHVEADGLLGDLVRGLGLEGFVRDQVTDALRTSLWKDDMLLKLPPELPAYKTVISSLAFVDLGNGGLGLDIHATAELTQDQLNELLKQALEKS